MATKGRVLHPLFQAAWVCSYLCQKKISTSWRKGSHRLVREWAMGKEGESSQLVWKQTSEAGSANREKQTVNSLHNLSLHPQRGFCSGKKTKKESTQTQCTKRAEEARGVGKKLTLGEEGGGPFVKLQRYQSWEGKKLSRGGFSSVQSLSRVQLFATPWITARQASLSITISRSSLRLMSIESVMPSSHLILCRPHLLLPPISPSIRVFSNESTPCIRWPKYWSFSFSIIPSKEIPGLISFRMELLDLLAAQGTLKTLLQHHSSKVSILRRLDFFIVQLSHPYMTTGKTIALTRWTLLAKYLCFLICCLGWS